MRRIFSLGLLVLVLLSITVVTASATEAKPYSSYDAWFQRTNQGCAGIYKCDCSPVDNYLYASAQAQYLDSDGTYKWTEVIIDEGWDVQQRAFVMTSPGGNKVYYVKASFKARCGSGSTKKYSDYASRK